jgi:hypothetical protein
MMRIRRRAALALAVALAAGPGLAQSPAKVDAAGLWDAFLAKATPDDVNTALDALAAVDYGLDSVDAGKCRDKAADLARAQVLAPVSIAVQRAALLCAEATGDHPAAERATRHHRGPGPAGIRRRGSWRMAASRAHRVARGCLCAVRPRPGWNSATRCTRNCVPRRISRW